MNSTSSSTSPDPDKFSGRSKLLLTAFALVLIMGLVGFVLFARSRSAPAGVKSPPNQVQAVIEGLAKNEPQVLWESLPPSYQKDVREVIGSFCSNMDAELYDRAFRVLNKAVKVLNEKENYFARSPVALSIPMLESSVGTHWRHDMGLLAAFANSDVSSLNRLKQMDPGKFLATTGHQLMAGGEELRLRTQFAAEKSPWQKLRQSLKEGKIEFISTTNGEGYLKFISPTNNAAKDVALTQVEGRWVPTELAMNWSNRVVQAKEGMAKLKSPEFARVKPIVAMVLGGLESNLDGLLKAVSQKEFDDKLKGMAAIGGMLRSLQQLQKQTSK